MEIGTKTETIIITIIGTTIEITITIKITIIIRTTIKTTIITIKDKTETTFQKDHVINVESLDISKEIADKDKITTKAITIIITEDKIITPLEK